MRTKGEHIDPWKSTEPALAVALETMRWYDRQAGYARTANQVSEALLLIVSAATTVAAALAVTAWITALLAAGSLVLTGFRKSFDWHETWLTFSAARSELRPVINQYRLLPDARRDENAQQLLMSKVDDIINSETKTWTSRRRKLHDSVQTGTA
jgi:hypothetical protein